MAVRMKDIARDLGVSVAGQQSVLALSRYSTSQIPTFYQPAFAPGNVRSALNPLTGAYLPAAYIGLFVPGTGNPANGGVLSGDSTYPRGFVNQAPRHRHAGDGRFSTTDGTDETGGGDGQRINVIGNRSEEHT